MKPWKIQWWREAIELAIKSAHTIAEKIRVECVISHGKNHVTVDVVTNGYVDPGELAKLIHPWETFLIHTKDRLITPTGERLAPRLEGTKLEVVMPSNNYASEDAARTALRLLGSPVEARIVTKDTDQKITVSRIRALKDAPLSDIAPDIEIPNHTFAIGRGRPSADPSKRKCSICDVARGHHS